ncbi:MAG: hypothetical protein ACLR17_02575 [Enterobacteriaceae bacterium]
MTHKLKWSLTGSRLTVSNPTPFYVEFQRGHGQSSHYRSHLCRTNELSHVCYPGKVTGLVSWKIISDFGGVGKSHTQVR